MNILTEPPYDVDQRCRVCGCTNECACVWDAHPEQPGPIAWVGCEWVEYDLCSCHAANACDRMHPLTYEGRSAP